MLINIQTTSGIHVDMWTDCMAVPRKGDVVTAHPYHTRYNVVSVCWSEGNTVALTVEEVT